ncbi:MAG: Uma2 family endonuclease [Hyphomicrobium sp.]
MSAVEFLAWAENQPRGRYELVDGLIVAMAPERADHARSKFQVCAALTNAIKRAGVPCEAFVDGLSVRINDTTVYEPDTLVNCGPRIPGDAVLAPNPVIVVEVLSPSTQHIDKARKLIDYFSIAAVHHYILIDIERRAIVHHQRGAGETVATAIYRQGQIALNPPGLTLETEELLDLA